MTKRVKHQVSQQRFDLVVDDPEQPDQKALDDFLTNLANHGLKSRWIIKALIKAYKERTGGPQQDDQGD